MENSFKDLFDSMPITKGALEKVEAYARLVCEMNRSSLECYGFLLTPKDNNDRVVYDAMLAPDQRIGGTSAELSGYNVIKAKDEFEKNGYKAIGCWQSHGNMGVFHSGQDDYNLDIVVNSIARNSEIPITKEKRPSSQDFYPVIQDEGLLVKGSDKMLTLRLPSKFSMEVDTPNQEQDSDLSFYMIADGIIVNYEAGRKRLVLRPETLDYEIKVNELQPESERIKTLGFAYSLVVNTRHDRYAHIAIKEWCDYCQSVKTSDRKIDLNIIEVENDVTFSEEELRREISRKVRRSLF